MTGLPNQTGLIFVNYIALFYDSEHFSLKSASLT